MVKFKYLSGGVWQPCQMKLNEGQALKQIESELKILGIEHQGIILDLPNKGK